MAPIDEQNIQPSITVVVKKPTTGSHSLGIPFLASCPGFVPEVEAGKAAHIGKTQVCRAAGSSG
jgi:hypothetical protein